MEQQLQWIVHFLHCVALLAATLCLRVQSSLSSRDCWVICSMCCCHLREPFKMSNGVQLSGTTGWFIVSTTKDNSTKLHLQNRNNWSIRTDGSPIINWGLSLWNLNLQARTAGCGEKLALVTQIPKMSQPFKHLSFYSVPGSIHTKTLGIQRLIL